MKKLFLLFFSLQTLLFACATCALMVPSVELEINLKMQEKQLEKINFVWHFSDIYTNEITLQFDKNKNEKLDEVEVQKILEAMLEYLQPKEMLCHLYYSDANATEPSTLNPKYKNFKLQVVDDFLVFTYDAVLQKEVTQDASLSLAFEDNESFFTFIMSEIHINESDFSYTKNLYLFTASISFIEKMAFEDAPQKEPKIETNKIPEETPKEVSQENFLQESINKIKTLFSAIKDEKDPSTYLLLLFFAYVYGLVHAMGPGHGKTLVASYFLANERSYTKALFISLAIGVVHTFSAFILTLIIYFILNTLLAQFLNDTVYYTTKISAIIIILIALYLLSKKYKFYKTVQNQPQTPSFKFTTSPIHIDSCACASCKVDKNSTDAALIISAGIIPCPGTTTIFIFAISMGLYYAGFISALLMSLGMSSIIFISALLSTFMRTKLISSSQKLKRFLEFFSLGVILLLGGILLFA